MNYYLLFYDVIEGYAEKRTVYRPHHLALVEAARRRGEIVLAGAYGDPPRGAILVFRAEQADAVRAFAESDPYVTNGLVRRWSVEPWHVVTPPPAERELMK